MNITRKVKKPKRHKEKVAKQKPIVKCIYERIVIVKKIPYWIHWFLMGLIIFILGEILSRSVGNGFLFWDRLIFSLGVFAVPTIHIWLSHSFEKMMRDLSGKLWERNKDFDNWLENSKRQIFTLHSSSAKLSVGLIVVFGIITVAILGVPVEMPLSNVTSFLFFALFLFITFTFFLFICGQALHIAIALLTWLARIVHVPAKVPFYLMPTTYISQLRNYYLILGFSILTFYCALFVAVWQGPYGFHPILLFWLSTLAFYPFGIFFVSFFQIHLLMRNIKNTHLQKINDEVQRVFRKAIGSNKSDPIIRLEKLMSIQEKVQNVKEWP